MRREEQRFEPSFGKGGTGDGLQFAAKLESHAFQVSSLCNLMNGNNMHGMCNQNGFHSRTQCRSWGSITEMRVPLNGNFEEE
jgi:hypothetical protein